MLEYLLLLAQFLGPVITGILAYLFGRKKNKAEVNKLEGEKKSIEAAAGLSTAEAASIISRAAADVVQPLTNRIRELQEDAKADSDRHVVEIRSMTEKYALLEAHLSEVSKENIDLKNRVAYLEAKLALLGKPSQLAKERNRRLGEL